MKENIICSYGFSELSENAKKVALESHRYDFCDENLLDFCDEITEKIKSIFEDVKFYYTGFYSQGDGACFTFKGLNFEKLFEELEKNLFREFGKKVNFCSNEVKEFLKENFTCEGVQCGNYYHENSVSIEWNCIENEELASDEYVADCLEMNEYEFLESGKDFVN